MKQQRIKNLMIKSTNCILQSVDGLIKAKNDNTLDVKDLKQPINQAVRASMDSLAF